MRVEISPHIFLFRRNALLVGLGACGAALGFLLSAVQLGQPQTSMGSLFSAIFPFQQIPILGLFSGGLLGFVYAAFLGYSFGRLYNYFMRHELAQQTRLAFEVNTTQPFNVLQEGQGAHPFTILFIANPRLLVTRFAFNDVVKEKYKFPGDIARKLDDMPTASLPWRPFEQELKKRLGADDMPRYGPIIFDLANLTNSFQLGEMNGRTVVADPIMADVRLFYKAVTRCLQSFVNNELLGHPEIFPKIRLAAFFDLAGTIPGPLCRDLPGTYVLAPLDDRQALHEIIANTVEKNFPVKPDVVFLLSASDDMTVSSAYSALEEQPSQPEGLKYKFNFDKTPTTKHHRQFNDLNTFGIIAMSAWDDRLKTPVHEFAHAVTSFKNGLVDDEYVDVSHPTSIGIAVNKKYRKVTFTLDETSRAILRDLGVIISPTDLPDILAADLAPFLERVYSKQDESGQSLVPHVDLILKVCRDQPELAPIPQQFGSYTFNGQLAAVYASDRRRHDKTEHWLSYVPERILPPASCSMDVAHYGHHYDKLIFDFLYDKMTVKLNR